MTHGANNNVFDPDGIPYALEIGVLKTNLPYEWVLNPEHGFKAKPRKGHCLSSPNQIYHQYLLITVCFQRLKRI